MKFTPTYSIHAPAQKRKRNKIVVRTALQSALFLVEWTGEVDAMTDELNQNDTQEQEPDEIDRFLATLPSLHIPSEMVESDVELPKLKPPESVALTSVFGFIAWLVLIIALLTASRAMPSQTGAFWDSVGNELEMNRPRPSVNPYYLFTAMCYLIGNTAVCLGGLGICAAKKMKMTGGAAVNFMIVGGLSAIGAVVLLFMQ
jgi:hypothetical protein